MCWINGMLTLSVSPMKLLLQFIGKVFSHFPLQRINPYIGMLQNFVTGNRNTKTYTAAIIESSMKAQLSNVDSKNEVEDWKMP